MIALDTNVLLRILVQDDSAPAQCLAARQLIENEGKAHISAAVLLETLWTLSRSYGVGRAELARTAQALLSHPSYLVESADRYARAIRRYAASGIDLADAVALEHALEHQATLHTFDRKLAKQGGARRM